MYTFHNVFIRCSTRYAGKIFKLCQSMLSQVFVEIHNGKHPKPKSVLFHPAPRHRRGRCQRPHGAAARAPAAAAPRVSPSAGARPRGPRAFSSEGRSCLTFSHWIYDDLRYSICISMDMCIYIYIYICIYKSHIFPGRPDDILFDDVYKCTKEIKRDHLIEI